MNRASGRILIADKEGYICEALSQLMKTEGLTALIAHDGRTALETIRSGRPDVLMLELKMPDMDGMEVLRKARVLDEDLPVILITAYAEVHAAVEAMRAGAHDYLAKPLNHDEVIRVILRALEERGLKGKVKNLPSQIQYSGTLREMMGPGDATTRLLLQVNRVAQSNFSVLILGETGSGKELIARAIHQASNRSKGPFIPVDCGAIPETLLESELFGHERGAFTGAIAQRLGIFEAARGGTLFLDEISNLPLASQAKLLRVLQERKIHRLGSARSVEVDVRVLAASNHNLQALATSGSFRQDLFFRLNEFTLSVPPLRERKEDILYLAKSFLDVTNAELNKSVKGFSESAIEALLAYRWPGNVRQLRSTIRRAVLLADELITEEHLDIEKSLAKKTVCIRAGDAQATGWDNLPLKEIIRRNTMSVEREVLLHVLHKTRGNKAEAARLLQVDYKTIYSKVKEYRIAINGDDNHG